MEKANSFKPCERGVPVVTATGGWRRLLMVLNVLGVEEGTLRRKKERKKEMENEEYRFRDFYLFFYFKLKLIPLRSKLINVPKKYKRGNTCEIVARAN